MKKLFIALFVKGKWYPVRQNDLSGYTHKQNLIKVFQ